MKQLSVIITCIFISAFSIAQSTFEATVSRNQVNTSDRFTVTFTLQNGSSISNFKAPAFSDFYVLGGPNQSSSFSSINGRTSQSISYGYVLQARTAGKFTIGSASIKSGKETLTTQPIIIDVSERPVSNNNNSNSDDESTDVNSYLKKNLFITASVDATSVFKGEEITVTYKLYVNRNSQIYDYRVTGATIVPKFNGFHTSEINVQNTQGSYETINGQSYLVQVVKKTKLTPQIGGSLEIDPLGVEAIVALRTKKQSKSNDPWDQFFSNPYGSNYDRYDFEIISNTLNVEVKELPANAPPSFNGAVGRFDMKTEINTTETKTDEPITYRIKITGNGNLALFQTPLLDLPPGWETYDPKVSETSNSKTYEYLLIPRSPGTFTLPAHQWSYFDPDRNLYQTIASEEYAIDVEAGTGYTGGNNTTGFSKEEVEMLAQDIHYIKTKKPEYVESKNLLQSPLAYIGLSAPILLGFFLFFFTARRNELEKDVVGMRNRKATGIATKRLKVAHGFIAEDNRKAFYDETIKAVWGYLSDRFNIPQSNLSKENIADILQQKNISDSATQELFELLNRCEIALFAPVQSTAIMQEDYNKAVQLISGIENELSV
ncbi:MAG: protein BatD [Chitinophagales bacterium]|nr:protein BatD [Chitinophagales bacterium]MBP8754520.1 protein BatD [Chitinophagales bacterium]MBP9190291.1 protein BatD [Chitinophagales bacterium]MBP9548065.1 protein BatD [Chitinophagales bacterium]MBP9795014.1 protein BatD [Chitinophagales bacterium]